MKKLLLVLVCLMLFLSFGPSSKSSADSLSTLAVITVDTTLDSNAVMHQACTDLPNDCSLRGAISLSNATTGGIRTIIIPAGVYTLAISGVNEWDNLTGSLDIRQPVALLGAGQGSTIIQAGSSNGTGIDRVFYITMESGTVSISNLTIRWGKIANGGTGGAGIYHEYADSLLQLDNVSVIENSMNDNGPGGGIYSAGHLTIRHSSISDNITSLHEGGGIYSSGVFIAENSTISGNTAGSYGGGLANQDDAILVNVTISGNSAVQGGGGIEQWNAGNLTVYNTTISDNTVTGGPTYGWAIYNARIFNAYNSIISATSGKSACSNSMHAGDHNIASDSSCGAGATVADPLLGSLADNGGFTLTHSLSAGSPAIDAADNTLCPVADQRGIRRRYDGDSNGSLICDLGAYEYNTELTLLNMFTPLIVRP
jgi:hypothetical protein